LLYSFIQQTFLGHLPHLIFQEFKNERHLADMGATYSENPLSDRSKVLRKMTNPQNPFPI
jgi:hypothetical protein